VVPRDFKRAGGIRESVRDVYVSDGIKNTETPKKEE